MNIQKLSRELGRHSVNKNTFCASMRPAFKSQHPLTRQTWLHTHFSALVGGGRRIAGAFRFSESLASG